MKTIKNIYGVFGIIITLLVAPACTELDLAPTNKLTEDTYWSSTANAQLVLNKVYNQMYNSQYFFSTEILSDNIYAGRGVPDEKLINSGLASSTNNRFANEWADSYSAIKTCHIFLENVDGVLGMDDTVKSRMIAEIRFFRAYQYFRLTTWYGDIPFFTGDISLAESKTIEQTTQSDVLAFVRTELDEVSDLLPNREDIVESERGRITSGAAVALLARTYLYSNDWGGVVETCEKLINTSDYGTYALFPSYDELFLSENEYNDEVILDVAYVPINRTWGDYFDLAPLSVGARLNKFAPTQELVDDYLMLNGATIEDDLAYDEDNPYVNRDPRLTKTVVYDGYQWENADGSTETIEIAPGSGTADEYLGQGLNTTSTGYYMRKYFDPGFGSDMSSGTNLILIRYADVLMMYAEAKMELGEMNQVVWDQTIREIRNRAGFTNTNALNYNSAWTEDELRESIRRERRVEFALEGTRIFDLRRWKTAEIVLNERPHGARFGDLGVDNGYIVLEPRVFDPTRDYLWAIPQAQRDINSNLNQNLNY